MEASLLQVYAPRDPLAEYLTGDITFRQLRVMVDGLARDSSTPVGRAYSGPWSDLHYLVHFAATEVQFLRADFENVHRAEGLEARTPTPLTTPESTHYQRKAKKRGKPDDRRARAAEADLLAVLNRQRG